MSCDSTAVRDDRVRERFGTQLLRCFECAPHFSPQETGKQVEEEEAEPLEDWQREVEEEEAEPLEDWQRQVEEGDIEEEAGSAVHQVHDGRESNREMRMRSKKKKKKMVSMALPFLTGISPAGFLSANRKQAGGTDHLVQVKTQCVLIVKI